MQRVDYKIPYGKGGLRSKTLETDTGGKIFVVVYKDDMMFRIHREHNREIILEKYAKTMPSLRQMIRTKLIKMGVKLEKIYAPKALREKRIKNLKIRLDINDHVKHNKNKKASEDANKKGEE